MTASPANNASLAVLGAASQFVGGAFGAYHGDAFTLATVPLCSFRQGVIGVAQESQGHQHARDRFYDSVNDNTSCVSTFRVGLDLSGSCRRAAV